MNQFNDQLPVSFALSSICLKVLHQYCRGQGLSPGDPESFSGKKIT